MDHRSLKVSKMLLAALTVVTAFSFTSWASVVPAPCANDCFSAHPSEESVDQNVHSLNKRQTGGLFPFGNATDDLQVPIVDDLAVGPFRLTQSFVFFGRQYEDIYVSSNGLLSFNSIFADFASVLFPLSRPIPIIAPFWTDININNGGSIYYRQTSEAGSLQKAQDLIRGGFLTSQDFSPTHLFIATWDRVVPFNPSSPNEEATFQAVLAHDDSQSFAIFLYGKIEWITRSINIGFNAGDGAGAYNRHGALPSVLQDIEDGSNIGRTGVYVFRTDQPFIYPANEPYLRNSSTIVFEGSGMQEYCVGFEGQGSISITLSTQDVTANDGFDYIGIPGRLLTIQSGSQQCFLISVLNDDNAESAESFLIILNYDNTSQEYFLIIEDDDVPVIGFEREEYTVTEGDPFVIICVTCQDRTNATVDGRVFVRGLIPGPTTASAFMDYLLLDESFQLSSGEKHCVNITIIDDMIEESDEEFEVQLRAFGLIRLAISVTTIKIYDNDGPPIISTHPSDQVYILPGMEATFTVVAEGLNTTYRWEKVGSLQLPSNASGEDTATLTISNVMEEDEGMYRCNVSNFAGMVTSRVAELTVLDPPMNASSHLMVIPGSAVAFTAAVTGDNLMYQWQKDMVNITGETASSYVILNVMEKDEGEYWCIVSNALNTIISSASELTVLDSPVLTGPKDTIVEVTQPATLTCSADSDTPPTFSWSGPIDLRDHISESHSGSVYTSTVTINSTSVERRGNYCCNASNDAGTTITKCATLSDGEIIVADQLDKDIGSTVMFICNITGFTTVSLTFSWRRNNIDLRSEGRVSGVNTKNLTIDNISLADAGEYQCIVSGIQSDARSAKGKLTVLRPTVSLSPSRATVNSIEMLILECSANNTVGAPNDLTFLWYFQNSPLMSGDKDGHVNISDSPEDTNRQATSVLTIARHMMSGQLQYICSATNREKVDASNATSIITVISPPGDVDRTTINQNLISITRVNLSWNKVIENSAPVTYHLSYCQLMSNDKNSNCNNDSIKDVKTNGTNYTFTGLVFNQWYAVNITTSNSAGPGKKISPSFIIKTANMDNIAAINFCAVLVTSDRILLSWDIPDIAKHSDDVIVNSSNLTFMRSESNQLTSISIPFASTSPLGWLASRLDVNVQYQFEVTIIYSTPAVSSSAVITTEKLSYTPTQQPQNYSVSSNTISLSWTAPKSAKFIQQYLLTYSTVSDSRKRQIGNISESGMSGNITGLSPFTLYKVQVLGDYLVNGEEFQAPVIDIELRTAESIPTAPQTVRSNGNPTYDTIPLTWSPPLMPNGVIQSYDILYSNSSVPGSEKMLQEGVNSTQYNLTGLDYITIYSIAVRARTNAGFGNPSDSVNISTSFSVYPPTLDVTSGPVVDGHVNVSITYSDEQGPISHFKVVVITDTDVDVDMISDNDLIHRADSSEAAQLGFYTAIAGDIGSPVTGQVTRRLVVGDGSESVTSIDAENNTYKYNNPPLDVGKLYGIFVRVYSSINASVSANSVQKEIGATNVANTLAIALGSVGGVVVLSIVMIVMMIICCVQKKSKPAAPKSIEMVHTLPSNSTSSLNRLRGLSKIVRAQKIIPYSTIRLLDSIGEGEYGIVYKAHYIRDVKSGPEIVAVKTLKQCYDMEGNSKIIQESLRMIGLDHPNVLGLIGVCVDAGPTPYLIMPYMGHGNLLSYLKKRQSKFVFDKYNGEDENEKLEVEKNLLGMCLQITKGMEYLMANNLVHRDLAARNCMMDLNNVIKVADFGLTEDIYTKNYFRQGKDTSVRLPMKWMAPECFHDCIFSEASDVWSFGVTCWEVYSGGRSPYPGIDFFTLQQELEAGRRMDKPLNAACSDKIYEIMQNCWNSDPSKRPTFSELVVSFTTLLEEIAGYIDLTAMQSETCIDAGEETGHALHLKGGDTEPQAL